MTTKLKGLIAATFTPLKPDGQINTDLIPAIVDHLGKNGLTGIYINGSTGEGPSLTYDERRTLAETYVSAAKGRLTTIIQVGSNSLKESQTLASHAKSIGADALSSTPPSYFKPDSKDTLVEAMAEITKGAPDMPFYYYHIPTITGVNINMVDFLKANGNRIPSLAGIKFCSSVLFEMQMCMNVEDGRYEVLSAWDEMLLAGKAVGAEGFIGSTFNFMAPLYMEVLKAIDAGNLKKARTFQYKALEIIDALFSICGRAGLKTMMSFVGLDCGPQRLPIQNTTPDKVAELKDKLDSLEFFKWVK